MSNQTLITSAIAVLLLALGMANIGNSQNQAAVATNANYSYVSSQIALQQLH